MTQPTTTASITKAGTDGDGATTRPRRRPAQSDLDGQLTTGFVGGETLATSGVTGSPALSTTTTNVVGTYPITAALGTLSAANYSFSFRQRRIDGDPGFGQLAGHC